MSEADYLAYQEAIRGTSVRPDVAISLDGDGNFDRHGTLDFIDNAVNRSSGTIHARATVPNPDLSITPGQFARLRVSPRSARAGPAGARGRRGPRPVAADRDDRGGGWNDRSEAA
jgi:multidrug efflux pump subunit AcrA (membrane-fusion protein)